MADFVLSKLNKNSKATIIDVGCGKGYLSFEIADLVKKS